MRVAVLASGRGSNLATLIRARDAGRLPIAFTGVHSDRGDAPALTLARDAGIATHTLAPADFTDRLAFDEAFFGAVETGAPELIVCAGYMRFISPSVVARYTGRIVNIHPSLLPKYPGLRTHARALAAGDGEHGASVHYVTAELDGGPVIARARIEVRAGDDAEALAARLLPREHALLVAVIELIARGRCRLEDHAVVVDGRALDAPLELAEGLCGF